MKSKLRTILAVIWCLFTVSMVGWWWVYALNVHDTADDILRKHRMFMWEGSIFLSAVVIGGIALIFLSYRDQKRHTQLKTFFASFSHDIKTSITRLRLQAEVLEEDNSVQKNPVLHRLINDISRLDLQLENSLLMSTSGSTQLLAEKLVLSEVVGSLRPLWSDLEFRLQQDAEVVGDKRAFVSVLRNIIQNSVLHGQATVVDIRVKAVDSSQVEISICDDGKGFSGKVSSLGAEMLTSKSEKGSGIGLYLSRLLMKRMNGALNFEMKSPGFCALLRLQGRLR